jgi:hypothetical protein
MVVYVDAPPSNEQLAAVRATLEPERTDGRKLWIDGVECDVGHVAVEENGRMIAGVLERFETGGWGQKALEGLLQGVPLHGAELIEGWQARARDYPPGLARAMVEAHLKFWPIWSVGDWVAARDMTLWRQHTLVESSHNVLGVLAGLNRVYYSPLYFKRLRKFVDGLAVAPERLADRIEALFRDEPDAAVLELERLVGETVGLVEREMPEVDTAAVHATLGARRGA